MDCPDTSSKDAIIWKVRLDSCRGYASQDGHNLCSYADGDRGYCSELSN